MQQSVGKRLPAEVEDREELRRPAYPAGAAPWRRPTSAMGSAYQLDSPLDPFPEAGPRPASRGESWAAEASRYCSSSSLLALARMSGVRSEPMTRGSG